MKAPDCFAALEAELRAVQVVPLHHPRHLDFRVCSMRRLAAQILDPAGELARDWGWLGDKAREHLHAAAADLMARARGK